jgi:SOS-response transcriptional repressor LexA
MLDDRSRKLLRILHNFSGMHRRPPSIAELRRMTQLTEGQIRQSLRVLADQHFIAWDAVRPEELRVIHAWEYKQHPKQPRVD